MSRHKYVGGYPIGDNRNWQEIEPGVRRKAAGVSAHVMPDIEGFWSPGAGPGSIEGEFIEGRKALRDYERRTGTRQIGDQIK